MYVEDHAKALIKVALEAEIGETYNIGEHNEYSNIEIVETICSILDKEVPDGPSQINHYKELITFVEDRPGHDLRYAIDASKIKNDLG